jgi:predicted nucleic acid-binding protein
LRLRVIVADTGPLHYLVLIDQIGLLPTLFVGVTVPASVHAELLHASAPDAVRLWAASPPAWLGIAATAITTDQLPRSLDRGEADAIALAVSLRAELILMDDRAGVAVARAQGFATAGTLGILDLAANRGIIDIREAITRLKATNFRYRPEMLDALVARHRGPHAL